MSIKGTRSASIPSLARTHNHQHEHTRAQTFPSMYQIFEDQRDIASYGFPGAVLNRGLPSYNNIYQEPGFDTFDQFPDYEFDQLAQALNGPEVDDALSQGVRDFSLQVAQLAVSFDEVAIDLQQVEQPRGKTGLADKWNLIRTDFRKALLQSRQDATDLAFQLNMPVRTNPPRSEYACVILPMLAGTDRTSWTREDKLKVLSLYSNLAKDRAREAENTAQSFSALSGRVERFLDDFYGLAANGEHLAARVSKLKVDIKRVQARIASLSAQLAGSAGLIALCVAVMVFSHGNPIALAVGPLGVQKGVEWFSSGCEELKKNITSLKEMRQEVVDIKERIIQSGNTHHSPTTALKIESIIPGLQLLQSTWACYANQLDGLRDWVEKSKAVSYLPISKNNIPSAVRLHLLSGITQFTGLSRHLSNYACGISL
ncbi:hypothetical protein SISNIDRAFT_530824 [Sistotremastrum niveocremeum HHB9708]|uniref:Uncharacterized protein n=1 Tax=Sistotremastrum niveocremeum HHB9708 TaxID=1314777 RepID=A0A164PG33_9AGAM|nr:hypothetical protein SISNIDRAFT_530824 [Sistotremastrum niveocremeum HHB9708]